MKRASIVLIIALAIVALDQATKALATQLLTRTGSVDVIGDFLVLRYAENYGAFLSLGATWPRAIRALIFGIFSAVIVLIAIVFVLRERVLTNAQIVSLSFLIGGGTGNLIDRTIHGGAVVDFLNIGIGTIRTGIFNVADIFLMVGGAMFLISSLVSPKKKTS